MPFDDRSAMSESLEFVRLALAEGANVSRLCRRFGIGRTSGYKLLHRYRVEGEAGLAERSRRPRTSPARTPPELEAAVLEVIEVRGEHPAWGGRKIARVPSRRGQALLARLGLSEIDVLRKVRIGLVSTGSELRNPGEALAPGQIYNSNRVLLGAMLSSCGWAEIVDFGIVADRPDDLAAVFGEAALRCDVVVSTGGASAGDEDHVVAPLLAHFAAKPPRRVTPVSPGPPQAKTGSPAA